MRKIIDGKLYDTETAELIFTHYPQGTNKRRDYYRTKKGTFFVHFVNVNKLELVTTDCMMDLLAEYDPDKYVEIFGKVEEG